MKASRLGGTGRASNGVSVTFRGGIVGSLVLLTLLTVEATVPRLLRYAWTAGPDIPLVGMSVFASAVSITGLGLGILTLHRIEAVTLRSLGLRVDQVLPAIVAVGGFFLAFNVVAAALALAVGAPESIGYHWTVPPMEAIAIFLAMVIVAGAVEEILFRGYLQTKVIASLGGSRRRRIAIGVLVASLLFAAYHIPRVLVDGAPDGMGAVEYLLLLTASGLAYGLLYEFTHNLYIPILVHAAGNMPGTAGIMFVVPMGWPTWAVVGQQLVYLGLFVALVVLYRRWGHRSGLFPVWNQRSGRPATA